MIDVNENGQTHIKLGYNDVCITRISNPEQNVFALCFQQLDEPAEPGLREHNEAFDMAKQDVIIDFTNASIDSLEDMTEDLRVIQFFKESHLEEDYVDYM